MGIENLAKLDIARVCRTCLSIDNDLLDIFDIDVLPYEFPSCRDMLTSCTQIKISEKDGLPSKICVICEEKIREAYKFIQDCKQTDLILHKHIDNTKLRSEEETMVDHETNFMPVKFDDSSTIQKNIGTLNCKNFVSSQMKDEEKTMHEEDCFKQDMQIEIKSTIKNIECDVCNKTFSSNGGLQRHSATHNPAKPYHCTTPNCRWSFATESELSVHINVNHNEEGKAECQFCQKSFKHKRNLRQHMLSHRESKRFSCKYCSKGFNHMHHLRNHENTHTKDHPFLCNECGKGFSVKYNLKNHMSLHSNERPHKCNQCNKSFALSSTLQSHKRTHTGERPYMCSYCGKTFSAKSNLNIHIENKHDGEQENKIGDCKFVCGVCQDIFNTTISLREHMKTHTRQYFCDICKKGFALISALENHVKTHSAGDRSHVCIDCGAGFNRSEHLRSHVLRKHTNVKLHKCEICQKSFTQSNDLNTHIRIHTGERPYTCQVCGRSFTQSSTLTAHMRIHTGERPYICTICNKGHCTAGALTKHMRSHSKLNKVK